ncbi:hypothetical protein TRFO_28831 [Tritrichomonas foetus]|uniref:Uncharacterized protein n=1 Tax=Tritrichomonas foetus TaxID=1144522 RepID=A0A1J4JX20_9EUKA|nr:hypothetical protein TRFO_28831 [Tritrichomonas foetus]|eukprot:OHT03697.1 hypothetical protein TRFO_28831 [Tritrichomonas foetus]
MKRKGISPTLDVPIEAPIEIKKKIAKKLQRSGVLKRIERKIKLGMMVAIEEIQEDPKAKGNLERKPFKNADGYENKALQAVFNYLYEHNMTYTLSALLEESSSRRNPSDTTNILDYVSKDALPAYDAISNRDDDLISSEASQSEPQLDQLIDSEMSSDSAPSTRRKYSRQGK